jgi:hypothetical protein
MSLSRRSFLSLTPFTICAPASLSNGALSLSSGEGAALSPVEGVSVAAEVHPSFPSHEPDVAREMVSVSHGNVARVKELLAARPALANAAWDWGYGDWESALGAASHVGNREIAALLVAAGARPSIFSAAMLGQLDVVKAFVTAEPGIQKTRGPHGITLLAHARAGGERSVEVVKYLTAVGEADTPYTNVPLTDADKAAIPGTYAFGTGATERLIVAVGERGSSIQRDGGVARGLLHQGERVFHPIGASAVRIRFSAGDRAPSITIEDGPVRVTATRVP